MRYVSRTIVCSLFALLVVSPALALTIWNGPDVTIVNPAFGGVQDALTANVVLTRASSEGLYNSVLESSYDRDGMTSPLDTQWAFLGLNGNSSNVSDITASNYANLTFTHWAASLDGPPSLQGNIVNRPGVVHLVSDDIYFNIEFTAWGGGASGGSFSYVRSSVPELVPGDANGDGLVNLADLQILGDNWQSTTATWSEADFTGDNIVNLADLQIIGDNWGYGTVPDLTLDAALAQVTIPEPHTLTLLCVFCAGMMVKRR